MDVKKLFFFLALIVFTVILFPDFENKLINIDSSLWSFPAHESVAHFLPILGIVFVVFLILVCGYFIVEEIGKK